MARLWSSGFEVQSVTAGVEWGTINGSPTISTSVFRSGSSSLRINPSSATQYVQNRLSNLTVASVTWYARFYIYITSAPGSTLPIFSLGQTTSYYTQIRMTASRELELWAGETLAKQGNASSALATDTWYRVEFSGVVNGSGDITDGEARLNGVQFATFTGQTSPNSFRDVTVGMTTSGSCDLYFDDVMINDSSGSFQNTWAGEGNIIHLMPNAVGDNSGWFNNSGTASSYTYVDEIPPDDATTYRLVASQTVTDDYNLQDASVINTGDTINVVSVGVRSLRNGSPASTFVTRIKGSTGGTVTESSSLTPTASWETHTPGSSVDVYTITSYTNPSSGTTWTKATVDTAQIGIRSTSANNGVQVTNMWLLVDYTAGTTPPGTISYIGYRSLLGVGL